ncbi:TetR/AcrR family transcriptional regulator [Noviherbaspirillum sp.]|uniref:TetR/AcrR family transcriptional regulator n=1 Tax=Noviherbaspirillum sp. TaxID=1926288 RepID=UPI002D31FB2C|nr:TetR/AcrR family transcriptional regulator [Noviherbaspirillum sp.]HZW20289.1 TetR/AcrR family transcriptional regulator [Noviherbaspirillum sp.]
MTEPSKQRVSRKRSATTETPVETERNLRAQGMRTRNAIIDAAKKLLLEGGSLEFTLREVAVRAEISISNLQYYFPTRLAVLRAVVEPVVNAYLGDLKRAVTSGTPPRNTLNIIAERAMRDAKNAERTALWWHFVSLAAIDPECSRLLDDWYETVTRDLAQLIRAAHPDCGPAESLHRATLLVAMADGLSFQLGAGRRKRDYTRGLEAQFLATADAIVRGVTRKD